ncbi:hypothetical protein HDU91_006890 [Kappamyces sp. JEL0680]|nr:hypothetical protein HDU91_006890 [Kappamyces sp. JEL0680]
MPNYPKVEDEIPPEKQPGQVCVVARTFAKQYHMIPTFVLSLSQNSLKPSVYLVITDAESSVPEAEAIVQKTNDFVGRRLASVLPITASDAQRYFDLESGQEYGYAYTDAAIDLLLANKARYPCDYFLFTNGDNLYASGFIDDYLDRDMKQDLDIIAFDFISHHKWSDARQEGYHVTDGTRVSINADFRTMHVDLGAFVIKAEFLAGHHLRFVRAGQTDFFTADGSFIEQAAALTDRKRVHHQVLMIHQ